ncbi:MAG: hypothetical protein LIO69_09650 [Oscillospiraceae bacterium]|nr:hypothetical protein [Oscillospiraceae bacterium]
MNDRLMKLVIALVAVGLFIIIAYQAYAGVTDEYKTETAVIYSSADAVSFRGVYIRNESVINQYVNGMLYFEVSDGSKVGNGSAVARVYDSEDEINTIQRISEVEDEIDLLEAAQNPGTTSTAQPEFISNLISEDYQTLATSLAKADVSDIGDQRDNLLTLMSIYQISIGKETNYNTRINSLYNELSSLLSLNVTEKSTVLSPDSGYFVSYTDGYESILSIDTTDDLTADEIKTITSGQGANEIKDTEIGKLIKGYNWKIAGVIDNSAHVYNAGDTVTLSFTSTPDVVNAVIERLDATESEDESVTVLRCEEMTYDLVQKRVERVEMTLNDFEGIRVSRDAIRFDKDNNMGVYVLWGQRVLFKKLDVIFESDDYLLSRITSDSDYVAVYDEIILDGVNTADYMSNLDDEGLDETEDEEYEIIRYTLEDIKDEEDTAQENDASDDNTVSESDDESANTESSENSSGGEVINFE